MRIFRPTIFEDTATDPPPFRKSNAFRIGMPHQDYSHPQNPWQMG